MTLCRRREPRGRLPPLPDPRRGAPSSWSTAGPMVQGLDGLPRDATSTLKGTPNKEPGLSSPRHPPPTTSVQTLRVSNMPLLFLVDTSCDVFSQQVRLFYKRLWSFSILFSLFSLFLFFSFRIFSFQSSFHFPEVGRGPCPTELQMTNNILSICQFSLACGDTKILRTLSGVMSDRNCTQSGEIVSRNPPK